QIDLKPAGRLAISTPLVEVSASERVGSGCGAPRTRIAVAQLLVGGDCLARLAGVTGGVTEQSQVFGTGLAELVVEASSRCRKNGLLVLAVTRKRAPPGAAYGRAPGS